MDLQTDISEIRDQLRRGEYRDEAAVKSGMVVRILHTLGWPVFHTQVVWPEYPVESRRVDYALCNPPGRPVIFVEVKRKGEGEGADKQLFWYAYHQGIPVVILVIREEWYFYFPPGAGDYSERRFYKLDLLEREPSESAAVFTRYLSFDCVSSGEARKAAQEDYEEIVRRRQMKQTLPRVWRTMLRYPDSLLVDLIVEQFETEQGIRPDREAVEEFLAEQANLREVAPKHPYTPQEQTASISSLEQKTVSERNYYYVLKGSKTTAKNAIDVVAELLNDLATEDPTFLDRFVARKHGTRRRYVAQRKEELYPDRPDLSGYARELRGGWWMGTNYSRREMKDKIIALACEVAGLQLGSDVVVSLG